MDGSGTVEMPSARRARSVGWRLRRPNVPVGRPAPPPRRDEPCSPPCPTRSLPDRRLQGVRPGDEGCEVQRPARRPAIGTARPCLVGATTGCMACGLPSGPRPSGTTPTFWPSVLAFEVGERYGTDVEDDLPHVRLRAVRRHPGRAGDGGHRRGSPAEGVDPRLGRGRRRPGARPCAPVRRVERGENLVVQRVGTASAPRGSGCVGFGGGSCRRPCSSTVSGRTTRNQLSMAPVGHGRWYAMRKVHGAGSTTELSASWVIAPVGQRDSRVLHRFLTRTENLPALCGARRRRWASERPPAATVIVVAALARTDGFVEVEGTAAAAVG